MDFEAFSAGFLIGFIGAANAALLIYFGYRGNVEYTYDCTKNIQIVDTKISDCIKRNNESASQKTCIASIRQTLCKRKQIKKLKEDD